MKKSLLHIFEDEQEQQDNIQKLLSNYVKGKISKYQLEESDNFINWVWEKYQRGTSLIQFNISESDFLESLDLSEEDIWVYNMLNNTYDSWEFNDFRTLEDDFKEGYSFLYDFFDEDNMEILKEIAKAVMPGVQFQLSDEYLLKLNTKLWLLFEGEIESLIQDYMYYDNDARRQSALNEIKKEFDDVLEEHGFSFTKGDVYGKVSHLVYFSKYFRYNGDLRGLYDKIIEEMSKKIRGGWQDSLYDYFNPDLFDRDEYNRSANSSLTRIHDAIFEENNFNEYFEMVNRITKKSPLDEWRTLPKNKDIKYKVTEFDVDSMRVKVTIQGRLGFIGKWFSEEDFNNFLYHPELFDLEY